MSNDSGHERDAMRIGSIESTFNPWRSVPCGERGKTVGRKTNAAHHNALDDIIHSTEDESSHNDIQWQQHSLNAVGGNVKYCERTGKQTKLYGGAQVYNMDAHTRN